MRDLNDPTLLGEHILNLCKRGMSASKAADYLYEDMSENGWHYGYENIPSGDPLRAYRMAQERRRAVAPGDPSSGATNGSEAVL